MDELIPELNGLSTLLSRSGYAAGEETSCYRTLYSLLGYYPPGAGDIPVAAVTRIIDTDEDSRDCWMRVDPVHLAADRDGMILMDSSTFNLTRHDALVLAGELNRTFINAGYRLEVPSPNRWYVKIETAASVITTEPDRVLGNHILQFLPKGSNGKPWHGLINEIQMILHQSQVNRIREEQGQPAVNSLWFWGTGAAPEPVAPGFSRLYSDDVFVLGLAKLSNIPCHKVPDSMEDIELNEDDAGIFIHLPGLQKFAQYSDIHGWRRVLTAYEQNWFHPIEEKLRQKRIGRVNLYAGDRIFRLTPLSLKKFWKRKKGLSHFIHPL